MPGLFTTGYSRLAFAFQPAPGWPPLDWRERLPPAFALERVDAARAKVIQENMGGPWFSHLWGSIEDFLARGVGFCIVSGDEVASSCLSAVIGGGEAEIQINTYHPRFHRRGLATLAATAFAELISTRA
jgi:hypothetical protein